MTVDDTIKIFQRVLETSEVTPDSDFFDLGGDSLLGTRVLSAVARATGVELSFDDFLLAATPGALAKRLAEITAQVPVPVPVRIPPQIPAQIPARVEVQAQVQVQA